MKYILEYCSNILFLLFLVGIPLYGSWKKLNVFDTFVTGAREGFDLVIGLVPYFLAMMIAVGMLRASGFFELINELLSPILSTILVGSII